MPAFWHWFIAAGTIAFVIWCVWLIHWAGKQGPQNVADEDLVGHGSSLSPGPLAT